jgi:thymidine kinase
MFAGKTSELIRRVDRYRRADRKCVVFKSMIDTRYDANLCCTHSGMNVKAIRADLLMPHIDDCEEVEVVAVDEGQFFADIIEFCDEMASRGKVVIVAALDSMYDGSPFSNICELLAHAEEVYKLSAVCKCGNDAHFSVLTTAVRTKEFLVGGRESYQAMCRKCRIAFFKSSSNTN